MPAEDCHTKVCLCRDNLVTEDITKMGREGLKINFLPKKELILK
jgi:hypothetical protein